MAWERRARGTAYYTRSRKVGGRVLREYVGTGRTGASAAARDAEKRAAERQESQARSELCSRLSAAEDLTDQFCAAAEKLLRATLTLAGFHQHHRGDWRRRRA